MDTRSLQSARLSERRTRRRRRSSATRSIEDEFPDLSSSSSSRPSTQDSKRSSYSRLSTDSGAGSLDEFNNRRNSSPDFWKDGLRRHTAPYKKPVSLLDEDVQIVRPNTVHAWDGCSPRCSLSRYAPLPSIGSTQQTPREYDPPVLRRRQCFMGPLDIDSEDTSSDVNENEIICDQEYDSGICKPMISLTLDSDTDSDFDEESLPQSVSETDDSESRPRRTIIRSATFTIEKERPDIRGPFLTIAVRLPDGSRVSGRFDCKDTLQRVCEFCLQTMEEPRPERYTLVTTEVPKRIFKNLTMSLKEAGIDDKTLMHLQLQSDNDSD